MKIENCLIVTSDRSQLVMSIDEMKDFSGNTVLPLDAFLNVIADEQRRVTSPEAVGALTNIKNAIGAMMEEPTP